MINTIRRIDYFHTTLRSEPGEAYKLLSDLKELGISLLAVTAIPFGSDNTQLTIFPEDTLMLTSEAKKARMKLDGPHHAILIQGDDELGVLASIHEKLFQAKVNVYTSSGITDGKGGFGYLIYVSPEQYEAAAEALGI